MLPPSVPSVPLPILGVARTHAVPTPSDQGFWTAWHLAPLPTLILLTAAAVYALVAEHGVDAAMSPPPGALARASLDLDGLGALPAHLAWIHAYLLGRYESDPRRVRGTRERPCSAP